MNHKQAMEYLERNSDSLLEKANNGDHLAAKVVTAWTLYHLSPNDPKSQKRLVERVKELRKR